MFRCFDQTQKATTFSTQTRNLKERCHSMKIRLGMSTHRLSETRVSQHHQVSSSLSAKTMIWGKHAASTLSSSSWASFLLLCKFTSLICHSAFSRSLPETLQDQYKAHFDINNLEFNLFFAIMSFPNIFLCLYTGLILEKLGLRRFIVLFTMTTLIGCLAFYISHRIQNYKLALLGRFLMGIGFE